MTATSPTALLAPAAPPVASDRAPSSARAGKAESFAQQLARQRGAGTNDTQTVAPPAARPAGGKPAAPEAEPDAAASDSAPASDTAALAAAGAAAASVPAQPAQAAPMPSDLPAQALEIATQAAQLQQQADPFHPGARPAPAPAMMGVQASADTALPPGMAAAGDAAARPAHAMPLPAPDSGAATAMPPPTASRAPAARPPAQAPQASAAAAMPPAPSTLESLAGALPSSDAVPADVLARAPQPAADHPAGTHHDTIGALASALHGATGARQDSNAAFLLPPGSGPLTLGVATPVAATPAWGADLGRQLVVLSHDARQNLQTAELRLDPPDLGPLRVTLSVNDGVANASFVSAHAAVRHAVEAALPQLQQALAQAGLSLGQANVGDHGAQPGFDMQQQGRGRGQGGGDGQPGHGATVAQAVASTPRRGDGLVDTFA